MGTGRRLRDREPLTARGPIGRNVKDPVNGRRHGRAPKPGHAQRAAASHGEVSERDRPLLACPDGELCAGPLQTSDLDSRLSASHATHKLLDTAPSAASCVPA